MYTEQLSLDAMMPMMMDLEFDLVWKYIDLSIGLPGKLLVIQNILTFKSKISLKSSIIPDKHHIYTTNFSSFP